MQSDRSNQREKWRSANTISKSTDVKGGKNEGIYTECSKILPARARSHQTSYNKRLIFIIHHQSHKQRINPTLLIQRQMIRIHSSKHIINRVNTMPTNNKNDIC